MPRRKAMRRKIREQSIKLMNNGADENLLLMWN